MQPKPKLKLRPPPSPDALAQQQRNAEELIKLDTWTEEPSRQPLQEVPQAWVAASASGPPGPFAALSAPTHSPRAPKPVVAPPGKPERPWHDADPAVVHAYNIQLPKPLQHKLDFVWKRRDCKSMKAFVVDTLTQEVDRILRELGETP